MEGDSYKDPNKPLGFMVIGAYVVDGTDIILARHPFEIVQKDHSSEWLSPGCEYEKLVTTQHQIVAITDVSCWPKIQCY